MTVRRSRRLFPPGALAFEEYEEPEAALFQAPSWFTQFAVLLIRQWRLLLRDRGQMLLQLALLFGFPCLVVIFAWDGLPQIANLASAPGQNVLQQILADTSFALQAVRVGGLVSGLVMFQVILLALMGSNNSAREIAGQRAIFEKEKFAGLRTSAFLASKTVYLAILLVAQVALDGFVREYDLPFPGRRVRAGSEPCRRERGDDLHVSGDFRTGPKMPIMRRWRAFTWSGSSCRSRARFWRCQGSFRGCRSHSSRPTGAGRDT